MDDDIRACRKIARPAARPARCARALSDKRKAKRHDARDPSSTGSTSRSWPSSSKGRITNVELADAVGLSPSPCLTRVKRLEKAGYITGYGAHVNLNKLGEFLTVFTEVTLSEHRRGDFSRFESRIVKIDEIVECHLVSGRL
jgi:hypothetical protein